LTDMLPGWQFELVSEMADQVKYVTYETTTPA
jgi:hypothetical protein